MQRMSEIAGRVAASERAFKVRLWAGSRHRSLTQRMAGQSPTCSFSTLKRSLAIPQSQEIGCHMVNSVQQKRATASDDVHLCYRTMGRGPAAMLLHGFSQWSEMWMTNGVANCLCERFTVILPDRRGHGLSGRPKSPDDFGMRMVEDVFCILDAEGHDTAHLIGFSQGSEVAWRAALEKPKRIRSLFLISSGWPGPELDVALDGYSEILGWLPQAIADGESWLTPNPDFETFQAIVASMPEVIDVPETALAQLTIPVFGLVGSEDPERSTIERLESLLPDFSMEVLPQTDHPGSSEHPDLPQLIVDFLGRTQARAHSVSPKS